MGLFILNTKQIPCLLLFLLHVLLFSLSAQVKDVRLPFINSYPREIYGAGTQNWDIAQDSSGIMYFANNDGLIMYNGSEWKTFPLPNSSIVRSVTSINDDIYVDGFNEFGYFKKDDYDQVIYHSLIDNILERDRDFGEIWRIFQTDGGIVFQSYTRIFIYSNNEFVTLEPRSLFGFSYMIEEKLYVVENRYSNFSL